MVTEFSFEILLFDINKGFNVLYTPLNCNGCTPIAQWVRLPPSTSESVIFEHLSNSAPHGEWSRQKTPTLPLYANFVGQSFTVTTNTATINIGVVGPTINPFDSDFANDIRSDIV
jgi:hypothetical protein